MKIFDREVNPLTRKQLDKKHVDAIRFLDDHYAYFVTYVLHLGRPEWTNRVPTAAVDCSESVDDDGNFDADNFKFIFNPDFAAALSVPEMAFIEAHETLHILLNHLRLIESFVDREKMKRIMQQQKDGGRPSKDQIKDSLSAQRDMQMFNVSADCVINDYLVSCGLNAPADIPLCRGEDWVGESAAYMTVTEVFNKIKRNQDKNKGDDGDEGEDGEDGEGEGQGGQSTNGQGGKLVKADGSEGEYEALDDHSWMLGDDDIDKMADAIDKLYDKMEQDGKNDGIIDDKKAEEAQKQTEAQKQLQDSMRAGSEDGNMGKFLEQTGVQLAWAKLMKEIDPDMFKEPGIAPPPVSSFHARRRKLAGHQFKRINLPVYRVEERLERETKEIKAIVLALDVSSSIGPKDAARFMTLAKSIPTERIKLFCCTFNTNYNEFDPQNQRNVNTGGGTSFDAIYHYIEDKVRPELKGQYPKSVVVITDGEAALSNNYWPDEKQAEGWFWLISPTDRAGAYYPASKNIGRRSMLTEFIA